MSGSFSLYRCGLLSHGDAIPPQEMGESLATASLPADKPAVFVVAIPSFTQLQATVRPWVKQAGAQFFDPSAGRPLKAESKPEGEVTVVTLEATGNSGDQTLAVTLTFPAEQGWPSGNSAVYLWRLNPADGGVSRRSSAGLKGQSPAG